MYIDKLINSITMYRLVLYSLIAMVVFAMIGSLIGFVDYSFVSLVISLITLLITCFVSNVIFCKIFKAFYNVESSFITALILFFILIPETASFDIMTLIAGATLAMASKYIFAIHKKHIFNPTAISVFLLGLFGNPNVFWWAGSKVFLPIVAVVGYLIVKKIRRFPLFLTFLLVSLALITLSGIYKGLSPIDSIIFAFKSSPLLFFGTVMLTEPLTMPPKRNLQIIYGVIVGILFSSKFSVGPLYSTPEFSLIVGNIFSYIVSSKQRLTLILKNKKSLSSDIYQFIFASDKKLSFWPGQYLEWTLPLRHLDSRGNRRYFTIASSPTENEIHLGLRMQQNGSAFKTYLGAMETGGKIFASQLSGDFILPADPNVKLVFIAGGIGVTPFRSMVKYLLDKKEKRDVVFFYASSSQDGFVYKDVFEEAKNVGVKTVYLFTDKKNAPKQWKGKLGYLTPEIISSEIVDYKERTFYLSGPEQMVNSYKKILSSLGIGEVNIKTDYFPGF